MSKFTKYGKIILNIIVFVLGILFFVFVFPKLLVFFMPFVIGWLISLVANPFVRFMERKLKIIRKHGSMLLIIITISVLVLLGYLAISKIANEVITLINNSQDIYSNLTSEFSRISTKLSRLYINFPGDIKNSIKDALDSINTYMLDFISSLGAPTMQAAGNFAKNIPATLIYIIVTILSSYFFIAEREKLVIMMRKHISKSFLDKCDLVLGSLKDVVGGYFKAQFKIMFIVAVVLLIGLTILQTGYELLFAILIAFLDFLPFFGTGTVLVPWAFVKLLSGDYRMAIGLFILYGVSQLIRQVIQPKIVGDTIGLDPLLTLLFLFIGYRLGSIGGMILAVPIGMIIINLYKLGIFDPIIQDIKTLLTDFNNYRKR